MPAWSGFWNGIYSTDYTIPDYRGNFLAKLALLTNLRFRDREILYTLVDGAVGDTALAQQRRVKHVAQLENPGETEVETFINSATTAAQEAALLDAIINDTVTTFVTDKSGRRNWGSAGGF